MKKPAKETLSGMTTWELIRTLALQGYDFSCGRHDELSGYYAWFSHPDALHNGCVECDDCGEIASTWESAGHAKTLHRAVVMAAKIALGHLDKPPGMETFEL